MKGEDAPMSTAAALLDRLGRPGGVRLGTACLGEGGRLPIGLADLERALGGGLPRGRVTELAGPAGAGRTGLACAIAASATRAGETIAWIDAEDALDPEAAAAAGVVLERTLWVRPRAAAETWRAAEILLRAGGFGLVVLDLGESAPEAAAPPAGARHRERRVRPATPLVLARAAEATRTTLLVATAIPRMGAAVALALTVAVRRTRWSGGPGRLVVLDGVESVVATTRSRVGRPGRAPVTRTAGA
jgi:hypothetical protein